MGFSKTSGPTLQSSSLRGASWLSLSRGHPKRWFSKGVSSQNALNSDLPSKVFLMMFSNVDGVDVCCGYVSRTLRVRVNFFEVCVFVFQGSIDGISTIYLYVKLMVTAL